MVRASAMPRALSGRSRSAMPGEDQSDLAWRSSINRRMARSIDFVGAKVYSHVCGDICGLGAGRRAWYGAQFSDVILRDARFAGSSGRGHRIEATTGYLERTGSEV